MLKDDRAKFIPIPVDHERYVSEDHAFCWLLSSLNYKVYVDSTIRCVHLRQTPEGVKWLK